MRRPPLRSPRPRGACAGLVAALLPGLLVACAGLGGCQADPGAGPAAARAPVAPSHDPIVFPHANPKGGGLASEKRPAEAEEAGFAEKWALASRYAAAGYDEAALQVLDAALAQRPDDPWGARLRGLRRTIRMRKTAQELLRAEIHPTRDYVRFGRPVDLVIRIRNVARETIALLPPEAAAAGRPAVSPSAVVLEIRRTDRDVSASELRRRWTQTLFLQQAGDAAIRIPPGGVHEQRARIPAGDVGEAISGFRTLQIGGTLRATRLRLGDTVRAVRAPLRAARVAVVPDGYEPLAEDPLGSLGRALEVAAPVHLLVATEFVPPARRVEAVEILARALGEGAEGLRGAAVGALGAIRNRSVGRSAAALATPLMDGLARWPARRPALMEGLRAVTGVAVAPDVRLWREWWRRARAARTSVGARGA